MIVIIIIKKQDSLEVFFVRPATNVIILNQILVGCNLNKTKLFFFKFLRCIVMREGKEVYDSAVFVSSMLTNSCKSWTLFKV